MPTTVGMRASMLLGGAGLGTGGAALLAAGLGAAGLLFCVLAIATIAVALSVTWRLDEVEEAPLSPTDGFPSP
jgi:hypothetical protein